MSDDFEIGALGLLGAEAIPAEDLAGTVILVEGGVESATLLVYAGAILEDGALSVTLALGTYAAPSPADLPTILPHNATALELALEQASKAIRDFPIPVSQLWDAEICPEPLLPWLAWALSVDDWQSDWPAGVQRDVILASVEVHRRKGTLGSVRRALLAAGFGESVIIEGSAAGQYDGGFLNDGAETHGDGIHWAQYQVILERPITLEQSVWLRDICAKVAPARCELYALDFTQANNRYNSAILNDGAYTHGVA